MGLGLSIYFLDFQNIVIDSCVLWNDSGYLQQASDLTGGIYIRPSDPAGLLQYLMVGRPIADKIGT